MGSHGALELMKEQACKLITQQTFGTQTFCLTGSRGD